MQASLRSVLVWVALLVGSVVGVALSAAVDEEIKAEKPSAEAPKAKPDTLDMLRLSEEAIQAAQVTSQVAVDAALQGIAKGHVEASQVTTAPSSKALKIVEDATQPSVHLVDSAIALGVQGRAPQQIQDTFGADVGQVWAWIRVANPQPASTHVTLVWRHGARERARVRLEVGPNAKGWRTWSSKRVMAHETGTWFVDVLDAQGQRVETLSFTVAPNA